MKQMYDAIKQQQKNGRAKQTSSSSESPTIA